MRVRIPGLLVAALSILVAFTGCNRTPSPPSERSVRYLVDPYGSVPARSSVSDLERASLVLEATGKQLGYGDAPGRALRSRGREKWAQRHALLIAHGDTKQLRAAWLDLVDVSTQAPSVSQDTKFEIHLGLGRVWDLEGAKVDEEVLRKAYLAELAYAYLLMGRDEKTGD